MDANCAVILDEIATLLAGVRQVEIDHLCEVLDQAPRVMAYATGRSGFLLRTFIMRLNHLGQQSFFVGDASTPPVQAGDCFLVLSGSGSTATSLGAAMEAVKLGAEVFAVVGSRISPLGQLAAHVIELPAPHKRGVAKGALVSVQTAGSLFEQAAYLLLEAIVLRRFQRQGRKTAQALARHANLEA